jgi:tripartite-type tricarboxylate transporter receptor subunit TctC
VTGSHRSRIAILLLALAMLVAACGGSSEPAADEGDAGADAAGTEAAAGGEGTEGGAWTPEFVDGVLQPLPDGFPEEPINLVVVDEPGSRDGIYARTIQEGLADISPVEIIVSDEPAPQGGTNQTLADTMSREGGTEGYWPVVTTLFGGPTDFHVVPIEDEYGISIDDITYLVSTEEQPYVMAQRADAEWGSTFAEWVEYAQAHPGELRYVSNGVGSGHDLLMEYMMNSLGIEVQKIPAAGHQEALAALGAGEGDFSMVQGDLAYTNEQAGRVDVIFVSTSEVPEPWASEDETVVSASVMPDYEIDPVQWGITLGFMVPSETPDEHEQWLYELFAAAYESDVYTERAETIPGVLPSLTTTEETQEIARNNYESAEPIIRELELHYEQT